MSGGGEEHSCVAASWTATPAAVLLSLPKCLGSSVAERADQLGLDGCKARAGVAAWS
jgi:hypothetical protein